MRTNFPFVDELLIGGLCVLRRWCSYIRRFKCASESTFHEITNGQEKWRVQLLQQWFRVYSNGRNRRCVWKLAWSVASKRCVCRKCGASILNEPKRDSENEEGNLKAHKEASNKNKELNKIVLQSVALAVNLNDAGQPKKSGERIELNNSNNHNNLRQFKCLVCNKAFARIFNLDNHIRAEHLPDNDPHRHFPWRVCDMKFETRTKLSYHIVKATFNCDYCQKQYKLKSVLATHIQIHSGLKQYKCKYCDETFAQWTAKKRHEYKCIKRYWQYTIRTCIIKDSNRKQIFSLGRTIQQIPIRNLNVDFVIGALLYPSSATWPWELSY